MTVENLSKYLMPTFAVIEEEGRLMYRKFESGPDHLNAATELIRRSGIFNEKSAMEMKLRTALCKQKEQVRKANETIEEHEDTIDGLEKDKKELQDIVKTKDERLKKLESEFEALKIAKAAQDEELKAKDTKITNLQVQWIERREVEEKEAAIGSLRDALNEIYEAMKTEFPSKEEKKSRLLKLADRMKRDYEGILREYRDDFGEFSAAYFRRPMFPPHPEDRVRGSIVLDLWRCVLLDVDLTFIVGGEFISSQGRKTTFGEETRVFTKGVFFIRERDSSTWCGEEDFFFVAKERFFVVKELPSSSYLEGEIKALLLKGRM
ncbi:hypothetical protein R1sor_020416 [Riccia sorocarpa]|uniref:Uncharacterized protein n=1 Tax=Riccia sorocarpa TaxID=122646 RepID=A0ABD3ILL3_9MARC